MPESKAQQETVARVMHEAKHGELKTAAGRRVKNPKQAVAIALREAGASKFEDPATNQRNLRRTKGKERRGETDRDEAEGAHGGDPSASRAALYAEAKRRGVPGRSKMSKDALAHALRT